MENTLCPLKNNYCDIVATCKILSECDNINECLKITNNNFIVFDEHKCKFTINNIGESKSVHKFKIDDCLIKNNLQKCDYGFFIPEADAFGLVELKGSDFRHAFEQIRATKSIFKCVIGKTTKIFAVIILRRGRSPALLQKEKAIFVRETGNLGKLIIKTQSHEEPIRTFFDRGQD